jgi:hypothetical protein
MTKEEYIQKINKNPQSIIYDYYKAKNKRLPMLSYNEFMTFAQLGLDMNRAFNIAKKYYEDIFNVVYLFDSKNNLIAII